MPIPMALRLRIRGIVVLALALLLVPVAVARADSYQRVKDYYAAHDSTLAPCVFSSAELQDAESHIPNDVDQYQPEFRAAIDNALSQRASGACDRSSSQPAPGATRAPGSSGGSPGSPGSSASPAGRGPSGAAPATSSPSAPSAGPGAVSAARTRSQIQRILVRTPAPASVVHPERTRFALQPAQGETPVALLALGALAAVLVVLGLLVGVARLAGISEPFGGRTGHAWEETRFRLHARWAALAERAHPGR